MSKYAVAVPIEKQDAQTVARAFVEKIVQLYGTPQVIQTDQGSNFMSEVFRNTCSLLKIKKIQSQISNYVIYNLTNIHFCSYIRTEIFRTQLQIV